MSISHIRLGLLSGLLATIVMDIGMIALFLITGEPASTFFSFIGESAAAFLSVLGVQTSGGAAFGASLHYVIGWVLGVIFVVAAERTPLREASYLVVMAAGIVYTETMSLLLLVPAARLLSLAGSELVRLIVLALVFHAVWGIVVGLVYCRGRTTRGLQSA